MQSWWLLQNRKATVQTRPFSCQKCGVFAVCPRPADQTLALCPRPRPLPGTLRMKHAPCPSGPAAFAGTCLCRTGHLGLHPALRCPEGPVWF